MMGTGAGQGADCRMAEGFCRGLIRRVPAETPEDRAWPPREGLAGISGLSPPCEGEWVGWGAEACNPVTWSSGGQIVPCDTKRKRRALAGLATALALGLGDKQRCVWSTGWLLGFTPGS